MRLYTFPTLVFIACLFMGSWLVVRAQDQKQETAPAAAALAPLTVEEQLKAVQGQLAALRQQIPQPTQQDQTERAKAIYRAVFKQARLEALAACKGEGGESVSVTVDVSANRVLIACDRLK